MTGHEPNQLTYTPPRFRWTRRIVLGSSAVVGLVIALWGGANYAAQRRMNASIAAYRASGEPVFAEDFNVHKNIPPDQNAATYYRRAEHVYTVRTTGESGASLSALTGALSRGTAGEYEYEFAELTTANADAIEMVRRGAHCRAIEWGWTVHRPMDDGFFEVSNDIRNLGKLLKLSAEHHHNQGNDRACADLLIAVHRLGNHCSVGYSGMRGHLIALSIVANVPYSVERIAPDLQISEAGDSQFEGFASRNQIQELISELLDESALRDSLQAVYVTERAFTIDAGLMLSRGKSVGGVMPNVARPWHLLIQPSAILNVHQAAELYSGVRDAVKESTYPRVALAFPDDGGIVEGWFDKLLPADVLLPSLMRVIQLDFRLRAERRMAAIALAIRLFELDHGHRPTILHELVPDYLDAVPLDPLGYGYSWIHYLPNAESPILYSRGRDGTDDGGEYTFRGSGYIDGDKLDLVYFLDGNRPFRAP